MYIIKMNKNLNKKRTSYSDPKRGYCDTPQTHSHTSIHIFFSQLQWSLILVRI